jgi:hypothetical protein
MLREITNREGLLNQGQSAEPLGVHSFGVRQHDAC